MQTGIWNRNNTTLIWRYRELIKNLTIIELKNRYQNTVLGFIWSVLGPLLFTGVIYFVFRHLYQQEDNYLLNVLIGIMAFRFFVTGTTSCLASIVSKAPLVTKVYIPRKIIVLSTSLACLISSLLEFLILIPIIWLILKTVPLTIIFYPVIHLFYFGIIYGLGLILASVYPYFRDLNQIWEVVVNILFFCSPIFYPLSIVPDYLMPYYMFNPITSFIIIYRDTMINGSIPSINVMIIVVLSLIIAVVAGTLVFNRLQRRFAEVI
jgi:lipopolysaccharide transport system permease protein